MPFRFGQRSLAELEGVHSDLVAVVSRGLELTLVDFSVHDGLRTEAEQREYVDRGVSTTMNSKHLPQPDGFGHAVDLVPYINGKLRWEWPPIYQVARAMHYAAGELGTNLRWGAVWDRMFNDLNGNNLEHEVAEYVRRREDAGKRVFLDGPHFELML